MQTLEELKNIETKLTRKIEDCDIKIKQYFDEAIEHDAEANDLICKDPTYYSEFLRIKSLCIECLNNKDKYEKNKKGYQVELEKIRDEIAALENNSDSGQPTT